MHACNPGTLRLDTLITMFKETPLLSAITVVELLNAANIFRTAITSTWSR
jgi:ABC-type amino acid transport system permease subunit